MDQRHADLRSVLQEIGHGVVPTAKHYASVPKVVRRGEGQHVVAGDVQACTACTACTVAAARLGGSREPWADSAAFTCGGAGAVAVQRGGSISRMGRGSIPDAYRQLEPPWDPFLSSFPSLSPAPPPLLPPPQVCGPSPRAAAGSMLFLLMPPLSPPTPRPLPPQVCGGPPLGRQRAACQGWPQCTAALGER